MQNRIVVGSQRYERDPEDDDRWWPTHSSGLRDPDPITSGDLLEIVRTAISPDADEAQG
jgi:hypothetical protein